MMQTILLVTQNQHKVEEIKVILHGPNAYRIWSLNDIDAEIPIQEKGNSFAENAISKNVAVLNWLTTKGTNDLEKLFQKSGGWLLADDSGLEVDALNGAPGIYSARYAAADLGLSGNAPDVENNNKLLCELESIPMPQRTAQFRCVLALMPIESVSDPADLMEQTELFEGICPGHIDQNALGVKGFGYDPLFIPDGYEQSFAELGESVKNQISHRARALSALTVFLNQRSMSI